MQDSIRFVEEMKSEISKNVRPLESFADRSKQVLLCELVRYIDFLFEKDTTYSHNISCKTANLIEYAVPLLVQLTGLKDKNIIGMPLIPSSQNMKEEKIILDELEIYGLLVTCENYIKSGMLETKAINDNQMELNFVDKYNDLERVDRVNTAAYSNGMLYTLMPYNINMTKESIIKPILNKMKELVYSWQECFIGYDADEKVDDYYINNATIDLIQDAEWNCFEQKDRFGDIDYEVFIGAVLMLESISIKHLQFVYLALDKYPNIDKYNILPVFDTKQTICESLQYFLDIDEKTALIILDILSLKQDELSLLKASYLPLPPYIEISKDNYIRSYAGCLYEPISYLLFRLKKKFPKDWDSNIQRREERFRNDIYDLFPNEVYTKFRRNIVLKKNGVVITDIDACLYDKETGDILFIQLKWQDSIYDSFKSMTSKRKNYIDKVNEWIETMQDWIQTADVGLIANYLQMRPDMIDKQKIRLLIVGRYNGEYSSSGTAFRGVVYCQWFELQRILTINRENVINRKYKLNDIYRELMNAMQRREQERKIKAGIEYNGKKVIYNGLFYNEA
jgi:hypothetical protein